MEERKIYLVYQEGYGYHVRVTIGAERQGSTDESMPYEEALKILKEMYRIKDAYN